MKSKLACMGILTLNLIAADRLAYIGTYTKPAGSKGIYMVHVDTATGKLSNPALAAESENPSFLVLSKNGKFLYAVNEINDGDVSAFAVEPSGTLRFLNKVKSKGDAPCHLNLDDTGKWLAVANYSSGSAAVFPVAADGKLGEAASTVQHKGKSVNAGRQSSSHAHAAYFSSDNRSQSDANRLKFCGAGSLTTQDRDNFAVLMRVAMLSSLEARDTTTNLGFRCAKDIK